MRHTLLIGIVCFSTACTVGPNYQRPSIATPAKLPRTRSSAAEDRLTLSPT